MLRRTCLGLVLAALSVWATDQADVEKAERAWAAAVEKGDTAAMNRLYADDMVYCHSTGLAESKAEYMAKLKT
ncbi:MAG: nuclear transport factor 2 family protein, partial [Bryobacter sp.]|nr:nuclear transport factor 2 family protein [Bryobacter sp.]